MSFNNITTPILTITQSGEIISANSTFESHFSVPKDNLNSLKALFPELHFSIQQLSNQTDTQPAPTIEYTPGNSTTDYIVVVYTNTDNSEYTLAFHIDSDTNTSASASKTRAETEIELHDSTTRFTDLFENVPGSVLEVNALEDGTYLIESANNQFCNLFKIDKKQFCDAPIIDLLSEIQHNSTETPAELEILTSEKDSCEVTRRTVYGLRDFSVKSVRYTGGTTSHFFLIYTDITERRERERRLQVFYRVLRHNIRNDMNVVIGFTDQLMDIEHDAQKSDAIERIKRKARAATDMSNTTQQINQLVDNQPPLREHDIVELLTPEIRTLIQDHPETSITINLQDSFTLVTNESISIAVRELIENAVAHNTDNVEVTVGLNPPDQTADGWVEIYVSDNGDGVPIREQELVTAAREITQLDHGTGLGLWLVTWVTRSLGGELTFDTDPDGDSIVKIRLPIIDVSTLDEDGYPKYID